MSSVDDLEMQELAQDEVSSLSPRILELERQLKMLLLPKDPLDEKNIVLEVQKTLGCRRVGHIQKEIMFRL